MSLATEWWRVWTLTVGVTVGATAESDAKRSTKWRDEANTCKCKHAPMTGLAAYAAIALPVFKIRCFLAALVFMHKYGDVAGICYLL